MVWDKIFTSIYLISLFFFHVQCGSKQSDPNGLQGEISISGAFALYPMVIKWSEEYQKLNPGVKFDIQAGGAGKGMTDALTKTVHLGMLSRDLMPEEIKRGAFPIAVAKDAVIATMSAFNPFVEKLCAKGISPEEARDIWITGKIKNWKSLADTGNLSLRVYTRSDAAGAPETWAKYLGAKQENLLGIGVFSDPSLAEAVINDKTAIGFNNISFVYNITTRKTYPGILPLPLDLNGNGILEEEESFYSSLDDLNEAIAAARFPSPPARPLYLVSQGKPTDEAVIKFITYILTDGQQFLRETGYVELDQEMLQNEMRKIND